MIKNKDFKIIAYFLPQFYVTPQNSKWWGEGFTEWTSMKRAKPLFEGHYQPRIPLNKNYYDLSKIETQKWQIEIAKAHGIYGFSYYHYWFKDGERMLEKPEQRLLAHPELDFPFCLCWANEAWSRRWDGSEEDILMPQEYGGKDQWREHFEYLLPFFRDKRYITKDGLPMFIIYRPELINCLEDMLDSWDKWAKDSGLAGIAYGFQHPAFWSSQYRSRFDSFSFGIETQPALAISEPALTLKDKIGLMYNNPGLLYEYIKMKIQREIPQPRIFDFDKAWRHILKRRPRNTRSIPCAFTDWDNSPRVGERGLIFHGSTPEKFERYITRLIKRTINVYKKDMLFINAWNEWAEGAYLEPDEKHGYAYLEAIKNALIANGFNDV